MRKAALFASLLLALGAAAAAADVFIAPRPLFKIGTEHFTFIFPAESRGAAEYLAREAEGIYDEVASALAAPKTLRIPVVITPDSEDMNGYQTVYPSNRIVLYQAPVSPNDGFLDAEDDLRKLFMHELAHAVSTTIRDPFWAFLAALFSDSIAPAQAIAPASFIEGVTVSLESRNGFGRAAETDYIEIVQQDIIEGRFKSFPEASGLWEGYPYGIHYVYGGLFSRYLQERYGMEKYAALWKAFGRGDFVAGIEGWLIFKGAFEKTYGIRLDDAWLGFRDAIALKRPVITALKPLSEEYESIGAACSDGRRYYWSESTAVKAYDPGSGKTEKLFDWDGGANRLSVSPDGERLLLSAARWVDGMPKMALRIWNLRAKRWETAAFPNKLREAAWLPDGKGIVACRVDGYTMDLVKVENGTAEVLLQGTQRLVPGAPCPLGDGEIAFLLKIDGRVRLARMELPGKSIRLLDAGTELSSVHYLSAEGGSLSFSYDVDRSFFKLGRYGPAGLELETLPLSGGLRYPASAGGAVYYVGVFSRGMKPMAFPQDNPELRMKSVPSSWADFDPASLGPSAYLAPSTFAAKPYDPLPWLLLPQLRLPVVTTNSAGFGFDERIRHYLNGAGISGYGIDPTEGQALSWSLAYKWFDGFAQADLGYACKAFPVDFGVSAYDSLSGAGIDAESGRWVMRRSLGFQSYAGQSFSLMPASRGTWWQAYAGLVLMSLGYGGEDCVAESSPYLWPFSRSILPFGVSASYSDLATRALDPNSTRGFSLRGSYQAYLDPFSPGWPAGFASAQADAYLPYLGCRLSARGAVAASPGLLLGPSGPAFADESPYLGGGDYPYYSEYQTTQSSQGPFILAGDASLGYSFRIDAPVKGSDAYMKSLALRGGYRACFAGSEYLNSAYLSAQAVAAWSRGVLLGAKASFGFELDWLLSRQDSFGGYSLMLRPLINYSM